MSEAMIGQAAARADNVTSAIFSCHSEGTTNASMPSSTFATCRFLYSAKHDTLVTRGKFLLFKQVCIASSSTQTPLCEPRRLFRKLHYEQLNREQIRVAKCAVARLMCRLGRAAVCGRPTEPLMGSRLYPCRNLAGLRVRRVRRRYSERLAECGNRRLLELIGDVPPAEYEQ